MAKKGNKVIQLKLGDSVFIGPDIEIKICEVRGDQTRIGITAPKSVNIVRTEIDDRRNEKGG